MPQIKEDSVTRPTLSLFQAFGVELEYMVVDETSLEVLPITDKLFHAFEGEYVSTITHGPISLDNELAAHIVEFKTSEPAADLTSLATLFQSEINAVNAGLKPFKAKLMPTAMHPWMDPLKEMRLWPHGCSEIYDTLHKIFDCRGHGWANLQSTHINLPFASEEEFVRLHAAIRLVLPLIPTLAASSPLADGRLTGFKDTRLDTYKNNQKKIFSVTAHVIPEVCRSVQDYHDIILNRIYHDLAPYDPEGILRYEWVNSRGAIARFERNAIEIRLIDVQESPVIDIAIVFLLTHLIRLLTEERWAALEDYHMFSPERLRGILDEGIRSAEEARIEDSDYLRLFGWRGNKVCTAKELWQHLVSHDLRLPPPFASAIQLILQEGTLSTRITKALGNRPTKPLIHEVYDHLCKCLANGEPFSS